MKVLVIIISSIFEKKWSDNIKILDNLMKNNGIDVEYCGISNQNDFFNYESIISFKYKIINTKLQLSKMCDFITDYKLMFDYTWFIKFRPEVELLENINFDLLSKTGINARTRSYIGPLKIKYGMSIGGSGIYNHINDCSYSLVEQKVILDDMIYIFHNNVVQKNAFNKINSFFLRMRKFQDEIFFSFLLNKRNISLNVIGINLNFKKYGDCFSGDLNL